MMERKTLKNISDQLVLVAILLISGIQSFAHESIGLLAENTFKAGASVSNITPFLGGGIVGNFGDPPPAKYIHDPLQARSLVLDDGTTKLVFVVCDNIGLSSGVCDEAKRQINQRTNIPTQHILISSTHTHSATSAEGEGVKRRGWNMDQPLDEYQAFIARRIADGVEMAIHNLVPAQIGWGSVNIPEHVFNRRWRMKDSVINPFGQYDRIKMNPGIGNPDVVEPAGPIDPQLSFLSIKSMEGHGIALLANYSLHYIGGVPKHDISADYFALFAAGIADLLQSTSQDTPFIGIMTNGTSGDINNVDVKGSKPTDAPYAKMRYVANDLAQKVFQAHQHITFKPWIKLQAKQFDLLLQVRKPDNQQLDWAKRILAAAKDSKPINHPLERTYAERIVQLSKEWPDQISVLLQTFRIGDVQIAAIPFETFAQTGLEIKAIAGAAETFTISFANGSYGYLPTPDQHDLGGYETWLGTNRVEKNASTKIVSAIEALFTSMQQQANKPLNNNSK